jgi:protein ImuB
MLFGCIYVPDFPVQAALLCEAKIYLAEGIASQKTLPDKSAGKDSSLKTPLNEISPAMASLDKASFYKASCIEKSFSQYQIAVLDGPANQMKVFACNEPARQAGIEIGMTKIQVEALPSVASRKRVLDHEFVAHAALLECACRFSPRLESTCPGTVIIDLTGTERLSGSKKKIVEKLRDAAQECGLSVNVALASNADTALYAALGSGIQGVTVIQDGEEAESLGHLPVNLFNLKTANFYFTSSHPTQSDTFDIVDALNGWGIRDFKSLAALPSVALTQRLGQYGLHLQRLAKGEVQRELVPYVEASSFRQSMELEECLDLLEPLGFVLGDLLERILLQLVNRSLATDRIQVDLDLEIHSDCQLQLTRQQSAPLEPTYQRVLKLPVPTQDAKIILKLLELDLAGKPPHAPVKKVSVEAFPARVKFGQTGLFQPVAPEPAKLELTLARLRSVVGDKVFGDKDEQGRSLVGFPVILDSNRPDSVDVQTTIPASKAKKPGPAKSKSIVPRHAMRVLRPPAEVRVGLRARVPATISFGSVRSKVMQVSGPWRTSGSWWDRNQAWNREEWDVEVQWQDGHAGVRQAGFCQVGFRQAIFRIFRDAASDRWYVEGIYA